MQRNDILDDQKTIFKNLLEETVREYERLQRVAALESSVNSSFDYIAELEKKYQ